MLKAILNMCSLCYHFTGEALLRKTNYLCFSALLFFTLDAHAQDLSYDWHKTDSITRGFYNASTIKDSVIYNLVYVNDTFDADFGQAMDLITPTLQGYVSGYYPSMIVLTKTNTDGDHIEAKVLMQHWQNFGGITINAMEITNDHKIVIVGNGRDTTFNFNPGGSFVGSYTSNGGSGTGSSFSFAAFYDLNGNYISHFEFNTSIDDVNFEDASVDENNNLYLCGSFSATVDFDFTSGMDIQSATLGSKSAMVSKVNLNTNSYEWTKAFNPISENSDGAYMNYVETKNNKIYLSGTFEETDSIDVDPSATQIFETLDGFYEAKEMLVVLDQNGNYINSISIGGRQDYIQPSGLAVDDFGNVFLSGTIYGYDSVDIDPSTSEQLLFDLNTTNAFGYLVKYDNNLDYKWHQKIAALDEVWFSDSYGKSYIQIGPQEVFISFSFNEGLILGFQGELDTIVTSPFWGLAMLSIDKNTGDYLDAYIVKIENSGDIDGRDFDMDENGNLYSFGLLYNGPVDFNSEDAVFQGDSSEVYYSPYMLKVHYCKANFSSETVYSCGPYTTATNTYTISGDYTESFIAKNDCDSVHWINLTVIDLPNLTIIQNGAELSVSDTISDYYNWLDCSDNSFIFGATSTSFTALSNGDYALVYTIGTCYDTTACVNVSNVSIQSIDELIGINVYPNPSTDIFMLELVDSEKFKLDVYDLTATLIYSKDKLSSEEKIDLSSASVGIYLLKLQNQEGQIFTTKLIKN